MFRLNSLHSKIFIIIFLLYIAITAVGAFIFMHSQSKLNEDKTATYNEIVNRGSLISSAISENNTSMALNELEKLKLNLNVVNAEIYLYHNKKLTKLKSSSSITPPKAAEKIDSQEGGMSFFYPIFREGQTIGTLYIKTSLGAGYWVDILEIIVLIVLVAVFCSFYLEGIVTKPLTLLLETIAEVTKSSNYSIQAKKISDDEIGTLTDAFNLMLTKVDSHSVLQASLAHELSIGLNLEETTAKVIALLCQHFKWDAGIIWSIDSQQHVLTPVNAWSQSTIFESSIQKIKLREQVQPVLLSALTDNTTTYWFSDLPTSHLASLIQDTDINSGVCIPIILKEKHYGWITCFSQARKEQNQDEIKILSSDSNYIAGFFARVHAQTDIDALKTELIKMSRLAGMSDVATHVLHNVGNVLNTVNVSVQVMKTHLQQLKLERMQALTQLLTDHLQELGVFFSENPRGKHVLAYLHGLSGEWSHHQSTLLQELQLIQKKISIIKEVIASQQSISKVSAVNEPTVIPEMMKNAVSLFNREIEPLQIVIQQNHHVTEPVLIDKFKTEQILVNLIRNAIDTLSKVEREHKLITVSTAVKKKDDQQTLDIIVSDNGEGISSEALSKMFTFGFTTKATGHGFGLHGSALAALEMNGALHVASDGPGLGATFTLSLPFKSCKRLDVSPQS